VARQILKKHDKMTGYNTRSKYMRRKVNLSSFSSYPALLQILASTEEMFHEVERDARMAGGVSNMKLDMQPQVNPLGNLRASHLTMEESSTPSGADFAPRHFTSPPHLTPSNSSVVAAGFPASVLWTSEEQDAVLGRGVELKRAC
jgi:SOS-response transcriptional repressor LexA